MALARSTRKTRQGTPSKRRSLTRRAVNRQNLLSPRGVRARRAAFRSGGTRRKLHLRWAAAISKDEWATYCSAMRAMRSAGIPFMLGGGFALAAFTGHWRDTKDIDFYVHPRDRHSAIIALSRAGFEDYYAQRPYDRNWIYRSFKDNRIVDVIWSMANQRAQVDELWFEHGATMMIRGERLLVVPPEEYMWCKLYILQRDHCDWTDVFNLLYTSGTRIDWDHLLNRLENDFPLLQALLLVYRWLCPRYAQRLPRSLWKRLRLPPASARRHPPRYNRIRLLDSRGWFAALQPPNHKLEI